MIERFAEAREDSAMGIFTTREAAEEFVGGDPFILHGVVRTGLSVTGTKPSSQSSDL
jgi:hypothetical protein